MSSWLNDFFIPPVQGLGHSSREPDGWNSKPWRDVYTSTHSVFNGRGYIWTLRFSSSSKQNCPQPCLFETLCVFSNSWCKVTCSKRKSTHLKRTPPVIKCFFETWIHRFFFWILIWLLCSKSSTDLSPSSPVTSQIQLPVWNPAFSKWYLSNASWVVLTLIQKQI